MECKAVQDINCKQCGAAKSVHTHDLWLEIPAGKRSTTEIVNLSDMIEAFLSDTQDGVQHYPCENGQCRARRQWKIFPGWTSMAKRGSVLLNYLRIDIARDMLDCQGLEIKVLTYVQLPEKFFVPDEAGTPVHFRLVAAIDHKGTGSRSCHSSAIQGLAIFGTIAMMLIWTVARLSLGLNFLGELTPQCVSSRRCCERGEKADCHNQAQGGFGVGGS